MSIRFVAGIIIGYWLKGSKLSAGIEETANDIKKATIKLTECIKSNLNK